MDVEFTLSDADLAALAHVVADPQAWAAHAFEHVGAAAVRAKIDKYKADYIAARGELGAAYKTRAQRDALEAVAAAAEQAQTATRMEGERAEAEALFNAKVAEAVRKALESR